MATSRTDVIDGSTLQSVLHPFKTEERCTEAIWKFLNFEKASIPSTLFNNCKGNTFITSRRKLCLELWYFHLISFQRDIEGEQNQDTINKKAKEMHRCILQIELYIQGHDDIDGDGRRDKYGIVRSLLNLKDDNEHYRQEHIEYKINPKLLEHPKMQGWLLDDDFGISHPSLLISGGPASGKSLLFYHVVERKRPGIIYSYCKGQKKFQEILLDFVSQLLWQDYILLSWFTLKSKFEKISLSETCLNNLFIRICKCRPHLYIALDGIEKCPDLEEIKSFLSIFHDDTRIHLLCTIASPSVISDDISWTKISITDYHLPDFDALLQRNLEKISKKFGISEQSRLSDIQSYMCRNRRECDFSLMNTRFSTLERMPNRRCLYEELDVDWFTKDGVRKRDRSPSPEILDDKKIKHEKSSPMKA